jgi:hypothetical protein
MFTLHNYRNKDHMPTLIAEAEWFSVFCALLFVVFYVLVVRDDLVQLNMLSDGMEVSGQSCMNKTQETRISIEGNLKDIPLHSYGGNALWHAMAQLPR